MKKLALVVAEDRDRRAPLSDAEYQLITKRWDYGHATHAGLARELGTTIKIVAEAIKKHEGEK